MRLPERDEDLDPRAERELDALERARAGEPVDPDLADWAELAALVVAERPEPSEEWSAEVDERVASRFGRGGSEGGSAGTLLARLRALPPRRIAAPIGALATLVVIAVVATSTLDGGSGDPGIGSADSGGASGGSAQSRSIAPASGKEVAPGRAAGDAASPAPGKGDRAAAPAAQQALDAAGSGDSLSPGAGQGKIAPGTRKRQIDRDVTLALTTPPEDVRDTADEAIAITRDLSGVVASSQVSRAGKRARATLQLTIPSRNLDTALDRLTALANVRALNEATTDVARPFVSAQNRLADARAERAKLLQALGNASTDAEAKSLRLQIKDARKVISRAEARFERVARRARLSDVSLTIAGDREPAAADGGRTLGGWLDDAGSVLRDMAGVLLISAAVLVPLAILAALAWFALSGLRRWRREQALDA